MELWCGHCAGTRGARMFDRRHPAQQQQQQAPHKYLNLTNYLGGGELFAGLLQQHSEMWQPLTVC